MLRAIPADAMACLKNMHCWGHFQYLGMRPVELVASVAAAATLRLTCLVPHKTPPPQFVVGAGQLVRSLSCCQQLGASSPPQPSLVVVSRYKYTTPDHGRWHLASKLCASRMDSRCLLPSLLFIPSRRTSGGLSVHRSIKELPGS